MDHLSELHGTAHFLIVFELCAASAFLVLRLSHSLLRTGKGFASFWVERHVLSQLMFCLLLWLLFYGQWVSNGRPVAAVGLAMPGSLVTRGLIVDLPVWLRRFLEPAIWALIGSLLLAAQDSLHRVARRAYVLSASGALCTLMFETALLFPGVIEAANALGYWDGFVVLHFFLWQFSCVLMVLAVASETFLEGGRGTQKPISAPSIVRYCRTAALLSLIVIGVGFFTQASSSSSRTLLVGAHYYSWFPENWIAGDAYSKLQPPVAPSLGHYQSANKEVFAQHVRWAREAGINYFVFDWWPERPGIGRRVYSNIKDKSALGDMKYAILYESLDLKKPGDKTIAGEGPNTVYMTKRRAWRLRKHWEYLAKHYMSRPEYLRIEGRPVLFVYATRHWVGPVGGAVQQARRHVKEKTGLDPYIVADEVFFNVLTYSNQHGVLLLADYVPEWDRLTAFDAVTCYNAYDSSRLEHGGSAGLAQYVSDTERLFRRYRAVSAAAGVRFVPGLIPGYNDRGVRLKVNHYVIPRQPIEASTASLFSEGLERLVQPFVDPVYPMFAVTSWNEWNEGTQIEPSIDSIETAIDQSESQEDYTQGEAHKGYARQHLDELRAFVDRFNAF